LAALILTAPCRSIHPDNGKRLLRNPVHRIQRCAHQTSADEARKKLAVRSDKGDDQDLYVFNDTQAVQVYYDKAKTVSAISIDFMSGATGDSRTKDVIGGEPDTKADGSAYKMVRYPKLVLGFLQSHRRSVTHHHRHDSEDRLVGFSDRS
jgi:hypothetical protein